MIWPVSSGWSMRSVGSSAATRLSAVPSLSSSPALRGLMASGSSGSGICQGAISSGCSGEDSVSPVSAFVSLATATMLPATAAGTSVN